RTDEETSLSKSNAALIERAHRKIDLSDTYRIHQQKEAGPSL
ncbi:hypothetical protein SAMN04488100_1191, partial [Alkalibacterium putridalgicola]